MNTVIMDINIATFLFSNKLKTGTLLFLLRPTDSLIVFSLATRLNLHEEFPAVKGLNCAGKF